MADEAQPRIYPNPPPYWITFTTANVEHIQRLREQAGDSTDALTVPSDLKFLVPPPEPANGAFRHFGETRNKIPLAPALHPEARLLHPDNPSPADLTRLTRATLLSFLEYVHILATNPNQAYWIAKWEDLRDVLSNAHHALNYYRPWAAREDMIKLLERRVATAREQIAHIDELEKRTDEVILGFQKAAEAVGQAGAGGDGEKGGGDAIPNGHELNGKKRVEVSQAQKDQDAVWALANSIEVEE